MGSGTQRQQKDYTCDTCCLLNAVLCVVLLVSSYYNACCLPRRVEIRHDADPEAVFGHGFIRNRTRISGWVPKTISEIGRLKNRQFWVRKGCNQVLQSKNVYVRIKKRSGKK